MLLVGTSAVLWHPVVLLFKFHLRVSACETYYESRSRDLFKEIIISLRLKPHASIPDSDSDGPTEANTSDCLENVRHCREKIVGPPVATRPGAKYTAGKR